MQWNQALNNAWQKLTISGINQKSLLEHEKKQENTLHIQKIIN